MTKHVALPALSLLAVGWLNAQEGHGYSTAQIERGEQIFFSDCVRCHGPEGDSVPGINLGINKFRHGTSDDDLTNIIRKGISGTPMPPSNYSQDEAGYLVAYLRSMANTKPVALASLRMGDEARGKTLFEGKGECLTCHRVNGKGSFLGPDLSEIALNRRPALLEQSLIDPDADIRMDNRTIRVTRKDGGTVLGRFLNQNTDSVQLIDGAGNLISADKADLRSFEVMKKSAMPRYSAKLSEQERADVLSYLSTLKGVAR